MTDSHSMHRDRLWTPWRMRYITHDTAEEGCIFCNRRDRDNDIQSLILHRAEHCFVIMNLYPYNTGHVMIVPNDHVDGVERLNHATLSEMGTLLPSLVRALRRVLGCEGFNIGINQGGIAGAGVAEHLHQHVVPRWQGDANFMPILAGTMVIPELIPSSYAKIRVELEAELRAFDKVEVVLLNAEASPDVWLHDGEIPELLINRETAVWRTVTRALALEDAEFVGYSGASSTQDHEVHPGLVIRTTTGMQGEGWSRLPLAGARRGSEPSAHVLGTLNRVEKALSPWIAPPRAAT